jgi:hypothetical protein
MTRKIFADECGHRALGIVRVAPPIQLATAAGTTARPLPVRDAGHAYDSLRVEAPAWAFSWSDVTAEQLSQEPDPVAVVAAAWRRANGSEEGR